MGALLKSGAVLRRALLLLLALDGLAVPCAAFSMHAALPGLRASLPGPGSAARGGGRGRASAGGRGLAMRDRSIVNSFKAGQRVVVAADVRTRGGSAAGLFGEVVSVWAKCEEDPICCCAENGMEEASVAVHFTLTEEEASRFEQPSTGRDFTSFFGVDELRLVDESSEYIIAEKQPASSSGGKA